PFMSPEQVLGKEVYARGGLFSLGVVLYEMATGTLPSQGESVTAVFENILQARPVPSSDLNPDMPKELGRIIGKAMEKSLELRYQTAGALRDDLKRLKTGPPARALSQRLAVAIAILLLAVIAGYVHPRGGTTASLPEQSTVVLGDFNNTTGEAILDQTLKQALRVQLEQSPFLNVLSEEKARQALRYM